MICHFSRYTADMSSASTVMEHSGSGRPPVVRPVPAGGRRGSPWLTLICVALGVVMVGVDGSVVAIANPYIARSLHATLAELQWVTNAYLLALAVLLVVGGKLGDRYGRRRVYLIGVVGFAAASVGVGLVGSIDGVIALRALEGAFGALLMPNTLALLRSTFPGDKLNTAVGVWGGTSAIAIAAGPVVGGLLVEHVSWQSVFYINAPIAVITVIISAFVLVESRESSRSRFDPLGLLVLSASLIGIVLGVIEAQSWGWGSPTTLALVVGGVALLALFAVVESKVPSPLVPLPVMTQRSVALGTVTVMATFFAMYGVLFFVALYLQVVHGLSPVAAGVRTLPLTIVFAFSSPLGGWMTQRLGPRVPITGGLLAVAVALFGLLDLGVHSSYVHLWPPFVLLGLGIGLVVVASTDAIVGNAPVDGAGIAGGIQSTAVQLGGVLGTAVLGSVIATRVGSVLQGHLVAAGVPRAVAIRLGAAKELVSQGVAPVPRGASVSLARAITVGSHGAFMDGLHTALLVGAVVALLGAVGGLFVQRGAADHGAVTVGI